MRKKNSGAWRFPARGAEVTVTARGGEVLGEQVADSRRGPRREARGVSRRPRSTRAIRRVLRRASRRQPRVPPRAETRGRRAPRSHEPRRRDLMARSLARRGRDGHQRQVLDGDLPRPAAARLRAAHPPRREHRRLAPRRRGSTIAGDDVVRPRLVPARAPMAAGHAVPCAWRPSRTASASHARWHGSVDAYRIAKMRIRRSLEAEGPAIVPAGPSRAPRGAAARRDADRRSRSGRRARGRGRRARLAERRATRRSSTSHRARCFPARERRRRPRGGEAPGGDGRGGRVVRRRPAGPAPSPGKPLGVRDIGRGRMDLVDNGVSTTPESTVAAPSKHSRAALPRRTSDSRSRRSTEEGLGLRRPRGGRCGPGVALVPFGEAAEALSRAGRDAGAELVPVDPLPPHHEAVADALRGSPPGRGGTRLALVFLSCLRELRRLPELQARAMAFRDAFGGERRRTPLHRIDRGPTCAQDRARARSPSPMICQHCQKVLRPSAWTTTKAFEHHGAEGNEVEQHLCEMRPVAPAADPGGAPARQGRGLEAPPEIRGQRAGAEEHQAGPHLRRVRNDAGAAQAQGPHRL